MNLIMAIATILGVGLLCKFFTFLFAGFGEYIYLNYNPFLDTSVSANVILSIFLRKTPFFRAVM